jgi:DNA-binding protein YbaB
MTAGGPDWNSILDPDAAMAQLGAFKARVDRTAADTTAMSDRLARLRVTTEDGNGLAQVTIDSTGVLVDLRLSRRIQRVAPDTVARAVLSALRDARQTAAERSREIIEETMGPDSPAAQAIAERVERPLRRPEQDDTTPGSGR